MKSFQDVMHEIAGMYHDGEALMRMKALVETLRPEPLQVSTIAEGALPVILRRRPSDQELLWLSVDTDAIGGVTLRVGKFSGSGWKTGHWFSGDIEGETYIEDKDAFNVFTLFLED